MKKYLSIILLVLLIPILFLTGCKNSEPTKITLTKDNYNKYISFNVIYRDFYIDEENNCMYCTAHITTHAIVDNVSFRYCNITMNILKPTANVSWRAPRMGTFNQIITDIDFTGYSESTFTLTANTLLTDNYCLPTTNINDINVLAISGQVLIN